MFDPKSAACNLNSCSIDTTPCANSQWSVGYPAYGLNGATYTGYSYKTGTGFESSMKPGTDGKYYIADFINNLTHDGEAVPMYKGMLETARTVSYLLYDAQDLNKLYDIDNISGLNTTAITFKNIANKDVALAPDGRSFVWSEFLPERPVVYVVRDETTPTLTLLLADKLGNPINFEHPTMKNMFNINDTISVRRNEPTACDSDTKDCCSDYVIRAIVAKGTAEFNGKTYPTITLEGGTATGEPEKLTFKGRNNFGGNLNLECLNNAEKYHDSIYPGDEVKFEYSTWNPCTPAQGGFQLQGYTMKRSNIQYIATSYKKDWAELRVGYAHPDGISAIIGQELASISRSFVEQMARAFYLGQNRDMFNAAGIPASTMGIITEIYAAHAQKPWLKLVRSAANAVTRDDKALIFLECLQQVQQSKWSGNNPTVSVIMDRRAISTYMMLRKSFANLGGWVEMREPSNHFDFSQIPVIQTPYGNMELLTCPFLEEISGNSGMVLFLDKNLCGARQTEEFVLDLPSNQVKRNATSGFRVRETTDVKTPDCREWLIDTSFCYIFIGVGQPNSPYLLLEAF